MTKTYEVRGSYYIEDSRGHATLADACAAVECQRSGLVSAKWPDGSVAYYLDQEDADRDQTGERAIAVATEAE